MVGTPEGEARDGDIADIQGGQGRVGDVMEINAALVNMQGDRGSCGKTESERDVGEVEE